MVFLRTLLCNILLLYTLTITAQSPISIEKMEQKLKSAKEDTNKVNILNNLTEKTEHINPNLALKYGEEALTKY